MKKKSLSQVDENVLKLQKNLKKLEKEVERMSEILRNLQSGKMEIASLVFK